MNFYTTRDFRIQPRQIWAKLSEVHELIITNNGKPSALMIEIDAENMEEILASVRQSMAMRATNKIRLNSMKNGNAHLTEEEIDAEIAEARKERRR